MAKWTLSEYIYQLRSRLDEFDEDLYSDEELTSYLNEGLQKLAQDLKSEAFATLPLEQAISVDFRELFIDSENALLPDIQERQHNLSQLRSLSIDGKKINLLNMEDVEKGLDGAYLWGEHIHFSAPQTGVLRALYLKTPSFLRHTTDRTDLPERFQDIPIEYAIAKAKQKDGEYGLYDYSLNQFYVLKGIMKEELHKKDQARTVNYITISDYEE